MFVIKPVDQNKEVAYPQIINQVKALIDGENNFIANLANTSSLLFHTLGEINWVGFYLYNEDQLILGPFHGLPACIRIDLGKGVCGTSAQSHKTIIVPDVNQFPGHIACDAASQSEIVVPMIKNGELIGVLDVDSPILERFDETDQAYLEQIVALLLEQSNV